MQLSFFWFFRGLASGTLTYTGTKCVHERRAWTPQMKSSMFPEFNSNLLPRQKLLLGVQLPLLTAAKSKDVDRAFFHNAISSR